MFEENSDSENLKRRITLIAGLKNNVEIVKKNLEVSAYILYLQVFYCI